MKQAVGRIDTAQMVVATAAIGLAAVLLLTGPEALLLRVAAISALSVALFATRLLPDHAWRRLARSAVR